MSGRKGLPVLAFNRYIPYRYTLQILRQGTKNAVIYFRAQPRKLTVAQGNCKFGAKCALAHILPNGRRVNRPHAPLGGQLPLGGRVDPQLYQQSDPALVHSLLAQQANGVPPPFGHQILPYVEHEFNSQHQLLDSIPTIETGYTSHPESKYGSPRDDNRNPISPVAHLSARDAPMPASFESQGISYIARHGPVAASVPSKFGLESPPSSLPKKAAIPTDAVRNLHTSVYGRDSRARVPDLGSSPLGSGDEGFGQRMMHSKRTVSVKTGFMSSSLPRQRLHVPDDEDEFAFSGEEDFLPPSLHDLLTPQERMRRLSRTEQDSRNTRENLSGLASPTDSNSKVGSPAAGSPSRYGAFFARQRQEEANNNAAVSAFGHVGSPLRNSSLHPPFTSPQLLATKIPGDMSPAFASPPRQSSMSMISQQLARQRISSQTSDSNDHQSSVNRQVSNTSTSSLHPGPTRNPSSSSHLMNRAVSSSSISGTGRIEEENDGVFSMEEEEDDQRKRPSIHTSGYASGSGSGKGSPKLRAIGSGRNISIDRYGFWS